MAHSVVVLSGWLQHEIADALFNTSGCGSTTSLSPGICVALLRKE
jgi:hypothetical protein